MAVWALLVGLVKLPLMFIAFVPPVPPVIPPVTVGADQLYKVPAGTIPFVPLVGVTVNNTPLQLTPVIAVTLAVGLIVTVTAKLAPVQVPDTGVTVYVALCWIFVGLNNVPLMFTAFEPVDPPVNPPVTTGALQLYKVPAGTTPFVPLVGVTVNNTPLQLTPVIAVTLATGLIVTVTAKLAPVQVPDTGVTVYVALCWVFVGLTKVPLMFIAFVPVVPPVNPPVTTGAFQLYKVPAGTTPFVPLVGVTVNNTPLQLTPVITVTLGVGLIVTVTVNVAPAPQLTVVGVTV